MIKHKQSRRSLLDSMHDDGVITEIVVKSEPKTLEDVKKLLESEVEELDHLEMPEHLEIEWSIPQHKWNKAK